MSMSLYLQEEKSELAAQRAAVAEERAAVAEERAAVAEQRLLQSSDLGTAHLKLADDSRADRERLHQVRPVHPCELYHMNIWE